ncbi:MAG: helix-turn-helix transcriptional regulator [Spirochaetes bacterium]|nr:helix-turn-helix transcriptional regulator [Spirochaetota bacterium]
MRTRAIILIAVLFALLADARAFPPIPGSIAVSEWSILYLGDDSPEAARNATEWRPIEIPSKFRYHYPSGRDFSHVWLRGFFEISGDPGEYYGISFGRIFYSYTIYLNGYLLDEKTPAEIGNLHNPEGCVIPRAVLMKGKNEILIRLGVFGEEYGGLPDGVFVQPRQEYRHLKNFLDLMYNQLPIGILLLLTGSILLMVAVTIFYGADRLFFYEILVLVLNVLYIITIFSPYKPVPLGWISPMLMLTIPLFAILSILIIEALYRLELDQYNRIIFPLLLGAAGALFIINTRTPDFYLNPAMAVLVMVLFFPSALFVAHRCNRLRPDRFKFVAVVMLIFLLAAAGLAEVYLYMTGSRYSFLVVTYFSPFVILGLVILGSREYQRRVFSLKMLYETLRTGGGEGDAGRAEPGKRRTVTGSTEEKLKGIITFIEENYTSDISREGLAAAVGMNPNYFSGQFKEYTGKKINDYINELRIREAVRRLGDTDEKIIDVALTTGFDSLSTFNRAFRSVMGSTPSEYRHQKKNH